MKKSAIQVMPAYFDRYIHLVEDDIDIMKALQKYGSSYLETMRPMVEKIGDKIYADDKWTIKTILQHIIDVERVFSYRAMRFSRNDNTPLPAFDEQLYAIHAKVSKRSWDDIFAEFSAVRQATILLFQSFDEEMLLKEGIASEKQVSVLALGFMTVGHLIHHTNIIKERYYPLLRNHVSL